MQASNPTTFVHGPRDKFIQVKNCVLAMVYFYTPNESASWIVIVGKIQRYSTREAVQKRKA